MKIADQFQFLCDILQGKTVAPGSKFTFNEDCHERLHQAMLSIDHRGGALPMDLAVLIRQLLRRESEQQGGPSQTIKVLNGNSFPDRQLWERCGVRVLAERMDAFLLQAMPWHPEWLSLETDISPETATLRLEQRRTYEPTAGDSLLSLVGHIDYSNPGQREAIRAVVNAPPGSTLVVNLPTGSGKSLCAQLPALSESREYGVTVVIVPTTALAIDQERAMAQFIDHPTAYYGDTSTTGQKRRQEIRERVRKGSQRLVFCSPESALESLTSSLYVAAERGFLRLFVIDEAHMVDQWGDGFRPAFQELPGLRRDLLNEAPEAKEFKTLLMTGTLTESTLDTLESLYGQPGPFDVISAMQLRPEPSYWFKKCETEEIRRTRILDALFHLPRPLILYTTLVEDAYAWGRTIQKLGARRFAVMTGKSNSRDRIEVIDRWRKKQIDVIVATSAFGLGVDQANVRTVVHACVPETIDRFYQEVGRGGRDGRASLSIVAYTEEDLELARRLNKKVSIGTDRGRQRWERMFNSKERLSENRWSVMVDLAPGVSTLRDINMRSEQNQKWNIRTLTLMACAGIIAFDAERPPGNVAPETQGDSAVESINDEVAFEQSARHQSRRVIRILDENHLEESSWAVHIEAIRKRRKKLGRDSFRAMKDALAGEGCVADLLSAAYTVTARESDKPRKEVIVTHACGGCSYCRRNHVPPYAHPLPTPPPAWQKSDFPIEEPLRDLLGGDELLLVFYSQAQHEDEWLERLEDLARWFLKQGVRNIVDPLNLLGSRRLNFNNGEATAFFFREFQPIKMPPAPSLVIHPVGRPVPPAYLRMSSVSPIRIALIPDDSVDPRANHRSLRDGFNGKTFSFTELCTILAL